MYVLPAGALAGGAFVNWENLGVHSMDMTPDGSRLLVASTPDNRLEVFALDGGTPRSIGAVPVGLDPVAVRARTNDEAWVVNHISDSISIVDLNTMNVVATLKTADEPCDVVFAGSGGLAFVSCSQVNEVQVFDPKDLSATPETIEILGEDPRAMAVSPDGTKVYVAIFESGNATTILGGGSDNDDVINFPPNVVSHADGPYGGQNPPPNQGDEFDPPQRDGNPDPPAVGLIVRKNAEGRWTDDNEGDWTDFVSGDLADESGRVPGWDMPDRDLAVIDADTRTVSYATGLMNLCMALGVNSATGAITIVGTDAINQIRFEPNVNGRFIRVNMASVSPDDLSDAAIVDLNTHLDYESSTIDPAERAKSIGDPRAIVWNSAGTKGYVAGMGSNHLIVIDPDGARIGSSPTIEVGEGPLALVLDESRQRLYAFNRFEASISVVDTASEEEIARVHLFDPSPEAIRIGRKHLYDTRKNSGLGHIACASCHVDARMDRLAWDLGNPAGEVADIEGNNLGAGILGLRPGTTSPAFDDFHPMKGPMATQTLQDIIGHEPHHWRGDRKGLEAFNPAFQSLLGGDFRLTEAEMQEFEDFLATIYFPPNPYRNFDNTLPTDLPLPGHYRTGRFGDQGEPLPSGDADNGLTLYTSLSRRLDRGTFACVTCHTLPTGAGTDYAWTGSEWKQLETGELGEHHLMLVSVDGSTNHGIKVPQIRNEYDKVGFNLMTQESRAGFGVLHDGSIDTLERFVSEAAFNVRSDQEVADLVAFILSISGSDLPKPPKNPITPPGQPSQDVPASVGRQVTFNGANNEDQDAVDLLDDMVALAAADKVGLVAKGVQGGAGRGYLYSSGGGVMQSDRAAETISPADLRLSAGAGAEVTFTVVPKGTETRIGIDRDEDGYYDRDEIDACSDPADAASTPETVDRRGDMDCTCSVDFDDIDPFVLALTSRDAYEAAYPDCEYAHGDIDQNGSVDFDDIDPFVELLIK
jgi:YVTN family beta-propeller protein